MLLRRFLVSICFSRRLISVIFVKQLISRVGGIAELQRRLAQGSVKSD